MVGSMMLVGFVIFFGLGIREWLTKELPPTGQGVVEGVIEEGPLVNGPFGQRVLFGNVQVTAIKGKGRGSRSRRLLNGSIGTPTVRVRTADGLATVTLPPYAYDTWPLHRGTYKYTSTLAGTGIEHMVEGWEKVDRDRFYVGFHGAKPGDAVIVLESAPGSFKGVKAWFGTREAIVERETEMASRGTRRWIGAGVGMGVFGMLLIGLHFVVQRRVRKRMPSDHGRANIPAWVSLALTCKGGRYIGSLGSRTVDAQCAYRKHGLGPIVIRVTTLLKTRLAFARRPQVGSMLDSALGANPVDGTPFGYPGTEVVMADPTWSQAALQNPTVRASVATLFDPQAHQATSVVLSLRPGALVLTLGLPQHPLARPEVVARWLAAMESMLDVLEGLPAPAEALEPTPLEAIADSPKQATRLAWLIVGGFLAFAMIIAAVSMMAL